MYKNYKYHPMIGAIVVLALGLAVILTACSSALGKRATSTPIPTVGVFDKSQDDGNPYVITIAEGGINITHGIPAGLVELTFKNVDSVKHSATLYKLKDGMPIEDFYALFQDNPRETLSITEALGSYEIDGNQIITGNYKLLPGIYIVVDDMATPPRYASFQVRD
jgi:hypothetical protein